MQRKYHKTQQVYTKDNENYRASTFLLTYLVLFIPYGTKASVSSFLCIQSLAACCASPHDRFIFSNSSDTVLHQVVLGLPGFPVFLYSRRLEIWFGQEIRHICLKHPFWKASTLNMSVLPIKYSHCYRNYNRACSYMLPKHLSNRFVFSRLL